MALFERVTTSRAIGLGVFILMAKGAFILMAKVESSRTSNWSGELTWTRVGMTRRM